MNIIKKIMIILSATLALWSCSDDNESTKGENTTISLSTPIIQMDKSGGDATVTVTCSGDWQLSGVFDWVHPSITSGKNGDMVTFTIDANSINEKRLATFKFFTGASVIPLQVESEASYTLDLLSDANPTISKEENLVKIEFKTNIANPTITYSNGGDKWLSFDKSVDFVGKTTFIFKTSKNETYKNRSTTITFNSPLATKPVSVNLTQEQIDAIIPENNTLINDFAARTISFKVRCNVEYVVTIPQGSEWITDQIITESQIGDDGLSIMTLSYKLNDASETRGGTIRIAKIDGSLISEIFIIQKNPNIELALIPDNAFRAKCISNKWVSSVADIQCVILEAGLKATTFSNTNSTPITDLTGIEYFPNLTSLRLNYCEKMKKLDISGLHKVTSVQFDIYNNGQCKEYNFGDNPITSFDAGGKYSNSISESLKFISSNLKSLNLYLSPSYTYNDNVTSIDVSECTALTTLDANRSNKVKTLYLKTGQTIPNLTKNDATTIVYK